MLLFGYMRCFQGRFVLHSFFYKNIVFPAQAKYSYFSADFRLKMFLYYSYIIAYGISVLEYYKCLVSRSVSRYIVQVLHRFSLPLSEYCTYVLYVPFIKLSMALNILL